MEIESIKLHHDIDYCPYEGCKGRGAISCVIANGKIVFKEKGFWGEKGDGKFLKRTKFSKL